MSGKRVFGLLYEAERFVRGREVEIMPQTPIECHQELMKHPEAGAECDWASLNDAWSGFFGRWYWDTLLMYHPEFADKCDWSQFDSKDLSWIFCRQPELVRCCDLTSLSGRDWVDIIIKAEKMADVCDWSKLSFEDWRLLLLCKPQFGELMDKITSYKIADCGLDEGWKLLI